MPLLPAACSLASWLGASIIRGCITIRGAVTSAALVAVAANIASTAIAAAIEGLRNLIIVSFTTGVCLTANRPFRSARPISLGSTPMHYQPGSLGSGAGDRRPQLLLGDGHPRDVGKYHAVLDSGNLGENR